MTQDRREYHRRYYLANQEEIRQTNLAYRKLVKNNPAKHLEFLEKARLYKRKRFGWVRTYKARTVRFALQEVA